VIDHVQSRDVAIVSDPCPPFAANDDGALLTLTWHLFEEGAVIDVVVLLHAATTHAAAPAKAHKWLRIRRFTALPFAGASPYCGAGENRRHDRLEDALYVAAY
jgi:hypothetical protein